VLNTVRRINTMNELNYGSFDACKRLQDSGIVVETEAYHEEWMTEKWRIVHKAYTYVDMRHAIPALSLAEAWRMLKPYVHGHYEDMRDRVWQALLFDNPTDAMIDLKIRVEKERTLDSMINNEAHKAAAGWHARARRMK
jgi:hypothetical protein